MKTLLYSITFFSLTGIFSCQTQTNSSQNNTIHQTISVDEFDKKLADKNIQLIDVRTPDEYKQGHLKNALNYNINSSEFENQLSGLDKSKPIMVYCLSGGRSASAAEVMSEKGFREVYNMQGGIMKWMAAGKPLSDDVQAIKENGMTEEGFNDLLKTDKYVLIDYNAKWCAPCKKMTPMLDAFTEKRKDKIELTKIDADENRTLLQQKGITSIPVLELYKDRKLIWSHTGEIDEATLIKETKL